MKIPQKIVEQILAVIPKENHVFLAMIFTTAGERNSQVGRDQWGGGARKKGRQMKRRHFSAVKDKYPSEKITFYALPQQTDINCDFQNSFLFSKLSVWFNTNWENI